MGKDRRKNERGITLLTALVTGTLIALAALTLSQLFSNFTRMSAQTDTSVKGDEVLVRTAGSVYQLDFARLERLCEQFQGFQPEVPTQCIDPELQSFQPQRLVADLSADEPLLGVSLDWDANPVERGTACVELVKCERQASGFLLDVVLRSLWSTDGKKLASRTLTIRRTRW